MCIRDSYYPYPTIPQCIVQRSLATAHNKWPLSGAIAFYTLSYFKTVTIALPWTPSESCCLLNTSHYYFLPTINSLIFILFIISVDIILLYFYFILFAFTLLIYGTFALVLLIPSFHIPYNAVGHPWRALPHELLKHIVAVIISKCWVFAWKNMG